MKVIFSEKQMDRFDAVVHEYLRANRKSVEYLAGVIGCNASSLWRYRNRQEAFLRMPMGVFMACMRQANVSNENLRYILGLPTGKADEK